MPDLTTNDSPIRIIRWVVQPGEHGCARTDRCWKWRQTKRRWKSSRQSAADWHACSAADGEDVSVGQVIAVFDGVESTTIAPASITDSRTCAT